ncbi:MAG: rod shape-determining protein MreC [Proteobacteria bacterium]|nr:rod shape-determining protein MreC [Pseudomonadota bacterium]NOG60283.1 rod shape-determining protein MreC [Pseudomonadota bacterium]
MNTLFQRSSSVNVRFAVFIILSIILMVVDHHQSHLKIIRSALSTLVYPLQYVVNLPIQATEWVSVSLVTHNKLLNENDRLKREHLLLSSKLQRFEILESENRRLRELLESSFRLNDKVLVAELIAVELQPFRRQIIINKGQREGAYDGQPIVDAAGIMGQIIHVTPFSSTVLLVTDPNHALPVQVNRNGLRAIAVGTGQEDKLLLENLPNNSDIRVGDLIISSGLGRRFPSGYPVGQIEQISRDPGEAFAKVVIKPSAQLSKSREVLMVWPYENIEQVENEPEEMAVK